MGGLFGCLAFATPRAALVVMWLTGYLQAAFESMLWPLLGFVFLPVTTIAYAWTINSHGQVDGLYTVLIRLAVLFDLGILGSARARRVATPAGARRRRRRA
ncbi:MAG: hypothetical protein IPM29_27870 [Planctomycetes bacterium]|nr:hypothetical protein [Planctomycetota bacterium]